MFALGCVGWSCSTACIPGALQTVGLRRPTNSSALQTKAKSITARLSNSVPKSCCFAGDGRRVWKQRRFEAIWICRESLEESFGKTSGTAAGCTAAPGGISPAQSLLMDINAHHSAGIHRRPTWVWSAIGGGHHLPKGGVLFARIPSHCSHWWQFTAWGGEHSEPQTEPQTEP